MTLTVLSEMETVNTHLSFGQPTDTRRLTYEPRRLRVEQPHMLTDVSYPDGVNEAGEIQEEPRTGSRRPQGV